LSQTKNAELKNEIVKLKRAVKNIKKQNRTIKDSSTHHEIDQFMSNTDLVTSDTSEQDASTGSEKTINLSLCDAKTMTKYHDFNNSDTTSKILESDNQIIEGLIQEITYDQVKNIVSSKINPLYSNNDKDMALYSAQSLLDLFDKVIKSGQKQILNWYYYSLEFENKVKSLIAD
ncbi:2704_t:CDS:2, partial [Diversispora eburnea]